MRPKLLTVTEVSLILRVSKMTVYRMIRKEEIRAARVGRDFRISSSEVRRVLTVMGFSESEQEELLVG